MDTKKLRVDATKVLSGMVSVGDYEKLKSQEHTDLPRFEDNLAPIDVARFGEFFEKCVGTINSTIKRSDAGMEDLYQMVVKDKIGFRFMSVGKPFGNARYMDRGNTYALLHPKHIPLVSKKEKREAVADFWQLKADYIERFHNIKPLLLGGVDSEIMISDVFDVAVKSPQFTKYNYETVGYMTINDRVINRDNVVFSMNDDYNTYASHKEQMADVAQQAGKKRWGKPTTPTFGNFNISCSVKENVVSADGVEGFNLTKLFDINLYGRNNQYRGSSCEPRVNTYGHEFTGIDVAKVISIFLESYQNFREDFNTDLEALRDKYLAEFVMNEICDEDSETSV